MTEREVWTDENPPSDSAKQEIGIACLVASRAESLGPGLVGSTLLMTLAANGYGIVKIPDGAGPSRE